MLSAKDLLSELHVVDLTHRLPGPMAGKLLVDLGAHVTKIEDTTFGDPFNGAVFSAMDDSFSQWYQQINANKKIVQLSFKKDIEEIRRSCEKADIILMGLPPKIENALGLSDLDHTHVSVTMTASHHKRESMHDLNVLAQLGYLNRHVQEFPKHDIIAPPFFPFAGVLFSQAIVQTALAGYIKALKESKRIQVSCALDEATKNSLHPLHVPDQEHFLHNGRYPCYNIYRLQDGHIALACLEDKFWHKFCDTFELELTLEQRFHDKDDSVKKMISDYFKPLTKHVVREKINHQDMCATVF